MSRWLAALWLTLIAISLAPGAWAQTAPGGAAAAKSGDLRHGAGLGFGQVFMTGDLNTNFSNNIGFTLNYSLEGSSRFGLLVNLHINSHSNPTNPEDSLSLKGLVPNLKFNVFTLDKFTVSAVGGMGAYLVSETLGTQQASFTLFTLNAGAVANVELDPHFRFGPSLMLQKLSSGTDASSASGSAPALTMGGTTVELFFNVMYFF